MRMRKVVVAGGAGLLAMAVLAGCASAEAGYGLCTLSASDSARVLDGTVSATRSGTLRTLENGCFVWESAAGSTDDGAWIVWPEGTSQDADTVVLASSDRVRDGDALTGDGVVVPLTALPGCSERSGSYFGGLGGYCGADARGVLVLTEVATAG